MWHLKHSERSDDTKALNPRRRETVEQVGFGANKEDFSFILVEFKKIKWMAECLLQPGAVDAVFYCPTLWGSWCIVCWSKSSVKALFKIVTRSNLFAVTAVVEDRRPLVVLGGFALVSMLRVAVVESPKKQEITVCVLFLSRCRSLAYLGCQVWAPWLAVGADQDLGKVCLFSALQCGVRLNTASQDRS